MADRWRRISNVDVRGEWVPFGPLGDKLPEQWTSRVDYVDPELRVNVHLVFDGQRVKLQTITLRSEDIRARDLVRLVPNELVHATANAMVQPGRAKKLRRRGEWVSPQQSLTPNELRLVAGVYWHHHVTWGEPRQQIMKIWGVSRSTANRWIRAARQLYEMPEVEPVKASPGPIGDTTPIEEE